METKIVEINGKSFTVHELLAVEFDKIQEEEDDTKKIVETIKKSADLTDENYNQLTLRERNVIQNTMAELNGWNDFQKKKIEESV